MQPVSVVIITKNEAENIAAAVISAKQITDDIIIADSGSTDETLKIATAEGAKVIQIEWQGFGAVKNDAALHACSDWIFSLDADERITPQLAEAIKNLQPNDSNAYGCKRLNFLYGKPVRHGEWGRDVQYRLYNRTKIKWTEVPVHESLDVAAENKMKMDGSLLHLTMKNKQEYENKTVRYATLMAEKYNAAGKKSAVTKQVLSPLFNFIQNYFFRLGFLDGKQGFEVASMSAKYTFLKYKFLRQLQQQHKN